MPVGTFTATKPEDCRRFFGNPDPKNTMVTSQLNGCLGCLASGIKYELYGGGSKCSFDPTIKTVTSASGCGVFKTSVSDQCKECFYHNGVRFESSDEKANGQCTGRVITTHDGCLEFKASLPIGNCSDCIWAGGAFTAQTQAYIQPWICNKSQPSPPSQSAPMIASGTAYTVAAKHDGQLLSVFGGSRSNGAEIIQWPGDGSPHQVWILESSGDGYYTLKAKHDGQLLSVHGGSQDKGAAVVQWPSDGGNNQKWKLVATPDGSYQIVAKHSGQLLSVEGGSKSSGAKLIQWPSDGSDHQKWKLMKAP